MSREVVTVELGCGNPEYSLEAELRDRILKAVSGGRRGPWEGSAGWRPWWSVRQAVGGRAKTAAFRAAVEDLLDSGLLVEAWLESRDRRAQPHVLVLPHYVGRLPHSITRARAREDVLARLGLS